MSEHPDAQDGPADYLLLNGRVRTVDSRDTLAGALAVCGRRILAVGTTEELRPLRGRRTQVIDLRGREVVPGFNDAHHHFGNVCSPYIECDASVTRIEDIQRLLRAAAGAVPPGRWLRARGYNQARLAEGRHPTRWDLDRAAPDHPVLLVRSGGHIGVANSRALAMLGVDEQSPDPPGGQYERVDGRLTGVLFERALYPAYWSSAASEAEILEQLPARALDCLAMGWTTLQDPGAQNPHWLPTLLAAEQAGRLPLRLRPFVELTGLPPHGLALFRSGMITGFGNDRLRLGPCKLMVDGSSSGPTAATREPYASQPDFSGLLQLSEREVAELTIEGQRNGFQMTMHAVGDRAIDICLRAFADADCWAPRADPRHRLEHCALCPADLRERAGALRVTPVVQPTFLWDFGDGYLRDYGPERASEAFPLRSFLDAGVVVAGSTDSPATQPEPLFALQQAVTRITRGGYTLGPQQRVTVAEALRIFTFGSAYAAREERVLGSLEAGKLADLVVLQVGLEDVPVGEIGTIPVDLTMVDGEVAFSR